MILFIPAIVEHDLDRLQTLSMILAVFYGCVLIAVLIDLWSGIDKAVRTRVMRTSFGFRKTIKKIQDYFFVLMLFTTADIVASIWFNLPFFTAIGTIGMIFVEARSVYENKKGLNKGIKDLPDVLLTILKNKDKAEELLNFLEKNKNDIGTTETNTSAFDSGESE